MPPRLLRPPNSMPPRLGLPNMSGMPNSLGTVPSQQPASLPQSTGTPNVLSAAPQLINRARSEGIMPETKKLQGATIEAKPQIRLVNLIFCN